MSEVNKPLVANPLPPPIPHRMAWLKSCAAPINRPKYHKICQNFWLLGPPSTLGRRGDLLQRVSTEFPSPHRCVRILYKFGICLKIQLRQKRQEIQKLWNVGILWDCCRTHLHSTQRLEHPSSPNYRPSSASGTMEPKRQYALPRYRGHF